MPRFPSWSTRDVRRFATSSASPGSTSRNSSFAAFLILTIGTTSTAYPLLPRHLTIAAAVTIGIPTFFLALAPSTGPWHPAGFARGAARFAVPAGIIVGMGVVASYLFALHNLGYTVQEARVIATTVLVIAGLYLVYGIEGGSLRRRTAVGTMCLVLLGVYVAAILLPPTRQFFDLVVPDPGMVITALAGALLAILTLWLAGFPRDSLQDASDGGRARNESAVVLAAAEADAQIAGTSNALDDTAFESTTRLSCAPGVSASTPPSTRC